MIQEFKIFVQRGNVIDLAVGVIIGAAFGKIVSSLVADVVMPILGLFIGGINLKGMKWAMGGTAADPVSVNYGNFLQASFDFLIIAFAVFLMVKGINYLKTKEEAPTTSPAPSREEVLLAEIRDILKARG